MRKTPPDTKLIRLVRGIISGSQFTPKVFFIDHDYRIREVEAPDDRGGLRRIEARLRAEGSLLAIVHLGSHVITESLYDTAVYYVPDGRSYHLQHHLIEPTWLASTEADPDNYFSEEGDEESPPSQP